MDRNGEHFLKEEYCFFDGKFKRCRDFVTLTASVYHPLLNRQIPYAVMRTRELRKHCTVFNSNELVSVRVILFYFTVVP